MEARELRIGNYIQYENNPAVQVKAIEKEYVHYNVDCYSLTEKMNPIPLTKEWLLNSSLKKHKAKVFRININAFQQLEIDLSKNGKIKASLVKHEVSRNEKITFRYIDFVHELQNLFQSLTGKELTITTTGETKS